MTVAREVLSRLERLAPAGLSLPRVAALHLPPASADGTRDGEFLALELDDGAVGLSYVLLDDTLARLRASPPFARLAGAAALDVARGWADGAGAERTIGFAAVNALTASLYARAGFRPAAAADTIGELDPRPGDRVGMVGLFPPLLDPILRTGARLTVVELKAHLAGERDGWRVTLDPEELRGCNKVLSTSTILLNDTLDRILSCCAAAEVVAIVGPGAGCLPDALFERGVTLVGGTAVEDRGALAGAIASGERWGASARKFALRRDAYPGFEALLARVAGASPARARQAPRDAPE